jgi:hypothetical protein
MPRTSRLCIPVLMATGLVAALLLLLASLAFAAGVGPTEYRTAAEPICQSSAQANERILANVRKEVKQGKLMLAAAKFAKASKIQTRALGELEALPQPVADEARLGRWLSYLKTEAELFAGAGKKLDAGQKGAAEHITTRLAQVANEANVQVLPFEFHYCRQEPSRFT